MTSSPIPHPGDPRRSGASLEGFGRDLRLAVRVLAKSPGFTAAAVVCLALGIGAVAAVFGVFDAVLLRALPFREPDRLLALLSADEHGDRLPLSVPEFRDLAAERAVFSQVAAGAPGFVNLTGVDEPAQLVCAYVTAGFFPTLGVDPVLGRAFRAEEELPANRRVVLLTDGIWRRRFGADPRIVGRKVTLSDQPYTVVGVLPAGFQTSIFPAEPEVWMPLAMAADKVPPRDLRGLRLLARLAPGVSLDGARAAADTLTRRFRADYPQVYKDRSWRVRPLPIYELLVGNVRLGLTVLFAAVGLVLLIACANVANLMLARATAREKEVALRTALGAGRGGLVRQFLAEALVLAAAGAALGLLLAWWALRALVALNPEKLPRLHEIGLGGRAVLFTTAVAVATAVGFGLVPALRASRAQHDLLKEGGKTSSVGTGRNRLRSALVVAEIALSLVVLVGAGLVVRSVQRLERVDPGFRADGVLTFQVFLSPGRYPKELQRAAAAARLLAGISALPGVERAGVTNILPLGAARVTIDTAVENRPVAPGEAPLQVDWRSASAGYFEALRIPLLEGRTFTAGDVAGAPDVAVIDDSLALRYWPHASALGHRLSLDTGAGPAKWLTIVGVVRNVRVAGLDVDAGSEVYTPFAQVPRQLLAFTVRAKGDPLALAASARRAVHAVDANLPVERVSTMSELVARSIAGRRSYALLLAVFAGVALALVSVGVYGVMSYSVVRRVQEIGIRMALGARRGEVLTMVVAQGMALAGLGIGVGLALALAASRLVASLLYGVGATDVSTFAGVTAVLAALALLACWLPARRATRVDPMVALRAE